MRKSIILPLLIVAIGQGVFGQSKETLSSTSDLKFYDTSATSTYLSKQVIQGFTHLDQGFTHLEPQSYIFMGGVNGGAMLKIDMPKLPIDSLIVHVEKSQLRWINDSTAVIHKSN